MRPLGYCSVEYDLESGVRGGRAARVESLLKDLTGAEDALVVNNCAAAALLILTVLAGDGETIVSRGELVEIGGDFRVPDVMASSGTRMVEVGTTNRTHLEDYRRAINAEHTFDHACPSVELSHRWFCEFARVVRAFDSCSRSRASVVRGCRLGSIERSAEVRCELMSRLCARLSRVELMWFRLVVTSCSDRPRPG